MVNDDEATGTTVKSKLYRDLWTRARLPSFRRTTYISNGDKSAKIPEIYARPESAAATATIISVTAARGEAKG